MLKLALLVGIDDYQDAPLDGCVNDALSLKALLQRNEDGSPNFECKAVVSTEQTVTRSLLRESIEKLFSKLSDVSLFFFAGHGTANNLGGYLVTQDIRKYDEGVLMSDLLSWVSQSPAREKIVVLDCCHSGAFGQLPQINNNVALPEGTSVLAACRDTEFAQELNGGGVFTTHIRDAICGGAADVCGK